MHEPLRDKAREALARIEPMEAIGWPPAQSIARQLRWCLALATGEPREVAPGPLSMGLIATREFDMHGDDPALARLINEVQAAAERVLALGPSGPGEGA